MKRCHVHLHVDDLTKGIAYYSHLFAVAPSRVAADHAKGMLGDPRVNFAISMTGHGSGIDHLGIQAEDDEELAALKARGQAADRTLLDEGETVCCYARSEKHWVTDPQGIAWEHFKTLDGAVPVYGRSRPAAAAECAYRAPAVVRGVPVNVAARAQGTCC